MEAEEAVQQGLRARDVGAPQVEPSPLAERQPNPPLQSAEQLPRSPRLLGGNGFVNNLSLHL